MLRKIDAYLIDQVTQPIVDTAAVLPELNRYNLSRISTVVSVALIFFQNHHGVGASIFCQALNSIDFINFIYLGLMLGTIHLYQRRDGNADGSALPSARIRLEGWRKCYIVWLPIALMPWPFSFTWMNITLNGIATALQILALYALACGGVTPPPLRVFRGIASGFRPRMASSQNP